MQVGDCRLNRMCTVHCDTLRNLRHQVQGSSLLQQLTHRHQLCNLARAYGFNNVTCEAWSKVPALTHTATH